VAETVERKRTGRVSPKTSGTPRRKAASRPPAGGRPVRRRARKAADQRLALALELQALRLAAEDCVEHYLRRIRTRFCGVVDRLETEGTAGGRVAGRPDKRIGAALDRLHALKLKPQKGRAKDLARIIEFLDELERLLPAGS
jgi:hypothetical protein